MASGGPRLARFRLGQILAHQRAHRLIAPYRSVLGLFVPRVGPAVVGDVAEPLVERPGPARSRCRRSPPAGRMAGRRRGIPPRRARPGPAPWPRWPGGWPTRTRRMTADPRGSGRGSSAAPPPPAMPTLAGALLQPVEHLLRALVPAVVDYERVTAVGELPEIGDGG